MPFLIAFISFSGTCELIFGYAFSKEPFYGNIFKKSGNKYKRCPTKPSPAMRPR
jgi:hypothetical protein